MWKCFNSRIKLHSGLQRTQVQFLVFMSDNRKIPMTYIQIIGRGLEFTHQDSTAPVPGSTIPWVLNLH